jgi:hypothetical protein
LRLQRRGLTARERIEVEVLDQLHEQLMPVDLGLEVHEHRAEADRGTSISTNSRGGVTPAELASRLCRQQHLDGRGKPMKEAKALHDELA